MNKEKRLKMLYVVIAVICFVIGIVNFITNHITASIVLLCIGTVIFYFYRKHQ